MRVVFFVDELVISKNDWMGWIDQVPCYPRGYLIRVPFVLEGQFDAQNAHFHLGFWQLTLTVFVCSVQNDSVVEARQELNNSLVLMCN